MARDASTDRKLREAHRVFKSDPCSASREVYEEAKVRAGVMTREMLERVRAARTVAARVNLLADLFGIMPPSEYSAHHDLIASDAGWQPSLYLPARRSGRTTAMCLRAAALVTLGKSIEVVAHTSTFAKTLAMNVEAILKAWVDAGNDQPSVKLTASSVQNRTMSKRSPTDGRVVLYDHACSDEALLTTEPYYDHDGDSVDLEDFGGPSAHAVDALAYATAAYAREGGITFERGPGMSPGTCGAAGCEVVMWLAINGTPYCRRHHYSVSGRLPPDQKDLDALGVQLGRDVLRCEFIGCHRRGLTDDDQFSLCDHHRSHRPTSWLEASESWSAREASDDQG